MLLHWLHAFAPSRCTRGAACKQKYNMFRCKFAQCGQAFKQGTAFLAGMVRHRYVSLTSFLRAGLGNQDEKSLSRTAKARYIAPNSSEPIWYCPGWLSMLTIEPQWASVSFRPQKEAPIDIKEHWDMIFTGHSIFLLTEPCLLLQRIFYFATKPPLSTSHRQFSYLQRTIQK